jgi:serine O-acetyltransferase
MLSTAAELTYRLLASYDRAGGINHVDGKNLPSKRGIADITVDLLRLLFPGFFDEKPIHSSEIGAVTTALLDNVLGRLENEIRKSLEYTPPAGLGEANLGEVARTLTLRFLGKLPRVRELLQTDTEAAYDGDPAAASKDEVIVAYPFIEAIEGEDRLRSEGPRDRVSWQPRERGGVFVVGVGRKNNRSRLLQQPGHGLQRQHRRRPVMSMGRGGRQRGEDEVVALSPH